MTKKLTIHDLADKLNLDASTVSRALNGSKRVKKETREKILKLASDLGYSRNIVASNLRTGRGNTIGVVVPRIQRSFFSGVIDGIESTLNKEGYNLLICQSNEKLEKEIENISVLLDNRVDGIIISVSRETKKYDHLQAIIDSNIPLIQFDRVISDLPSDYVVNDNWQGTYDAVQHLAEQGCSRIVHLAGPISIGLYKERRRGYKDAIKHFGLEFDEDLIVRAITEKTGFEAITTLLGKGIGFDGIVSASDFSAIGAMKALKLNKIDIPNDVAVVGFANEPLTEIILPPLTSLDQFKVEMGIEAANLVLSQLKNSSNQITVQKKISLKPKLIVRSSSQRIS